MAVSNGGPKKRSEPHNAGIEHGKWYQLKVVTAGNNIKCYINDQLVNEESFDNYPSGSIGLGSNLSSVEFRELKVIAPDGKELLEAL
jgi:hypothetical protein